MTTKTARGYFEISRETRVLASSWKFPKSTCVVASLHNSHAIKMSVNEEEDHVLQTGLFQFLAVIFVSYSLVSKIWRVHFRFIDLKSLFVTTLTQSTWICFFDVGERHTCLIVYSTFCLWSLGLAFHFLGLKDKDYSFHIFFIIQTMFSQLELQSDHQGSCQQICFRVHSQQNKSKSYFINNLQKTLDQRWRPRLFQIINKETCLSLLSL